MCLNIPGLKTLHHQMRTRCSQATASAKAASSTSLQTVGGVGGGGGGGEGNLELCSLVNDSPVGFGVQLRIALGARQQLPQIQHQVAMPTPSIGKRSTTECPESLHPFQLAGSFLLHLWRMTRLE